jgi:uncharacterized protein YegL
LVGALPFDEDDATQAALLEEMRELAAAGEQVLRAEWAGNLITFDAQGQQATAGGEYSCLKIHSATNWLGDANVHPCACAGIATWHDPNQDGSLVPLIIEPRLRCVRDFLEDEDGTFWLTGSLSGSMGREIALLRVDDEWNVTQISYGSQFVHQEMRRGKHSGVMLGACAGRAIVREGSDLFVLSALDLLRHRAASVHPMRLEEIGVGGLACTRLVRMDGAEVVARSVDPDVALAPNWFAAFSRYGAGTGTARVLYSVPPYYGPPLAKHYEGALCAKETFWGVVEDVGKEGEGEAPKAPQDETEKEAEDNRQGLARFTLGGLEVLHWWKRSEWDMGRVIPWPKGVYAFGFNAAGIPRAMRWTGDGDGLLEMGLETPFLVLGGKCELTPDEQSETLRIVGKKFFGRRALPGSYAAEGAYGSRVGGVGAGAGPVQVDFGWSAGAGGFVLTRDDLAAAGFDHDAFPPYLVWSAVGAAWLASGSAPSDGTPYLIFNGSGDPLKYLPGPGVTLPYNVTKFCGLRFTSGTCQGVVAYPPPTVLNCGPLDVAMCVDITGSMGGAIANVRRELATIVADIEAASNADYRLSLVTFKDNVRVNVPFALNNAAAFTSALQVLEAEGGSNEPEASDEALRTCVRALAAAGRPQQVGDFAAWRPGARKIVILVTDARPGSFDDTFTPGVHDARALQVAQDAAARGILVSAVYTPLAGAQATRDATITQIMADYAVTTGGLFVRTQSDGKGTGAAISDIINSCGGNADAVYVEYCTDDVVLPVSCCSSALCAFDSDAPNGGGGAGGGGGSGARKRLGHFSVEALGPINAVWFQEKDNPEAFAAMCRGEQRLWARIDGEELLSFDSAGALTSAGRTVLGQFTIPIPLEREFWLPRQARRVDVVAIVDEGVVVNATLQAVH